MTGKLVVDTHFQPMRFGSYLLLDRINVGGMAEVFRAKSFGMAGVERLVAIKRILPHLAQDPDFTNMFIDEYRIAAQLRHANIAQLYDLNEIGQSLYIAMEYVQGRDLRALINRMRFLAQPIPLPLVVYIISKVCEGLDYAHRKRDDLSMRELHIVHRDVSPQNVILSYEGEVKIIDFGIAKASAKKTHTQAGILKGKFGYMAPEQVMGQEIDRRTDIFCTGILTYELLTRERLFAGSNELSTLRRIRQREIIPPSMLNLNVPKPIEDMVLKALALNPDDRFAYASDYGDALQRALLECGEEPYTSRHMRNFMHDIFGKDLHEDFQRLEAVLQRAEELEKSGIWDTSPVSVPPPPETLTEGTHEQTNPSWHSDSLAAALSNPETRDLYRDTPSPFAEKSGQSQVAGESTHSTKHPASASPSHTGTTQETPLPGEPGFSPAPANSYSTMEADFSEPWQELVEVSDEDEPSARLPNVRKSFSSVPAVAESRQNPPEANPPNLATSTLENTKNIRPPAPPEKKLVAPLFENERISPPAPPSSLYPDRASTSGEILRYQEPMQSERTRHGFAYLDDYLPASPVPTARPEMPAKSKKKNAMVWLVLWGFLFVSLAIMLYLLLIVPAPEPIPSPTDATSHSSGNSQPLSPSTTKEQPKADQQPQPRVSATNMARGAHAPQNVSSTTAAQTNHRDNPTAGRLQTTGQANPHPDRNTPVRSEVPEGSKATQPGQMIRLHIVTKPEGANVLFQGVSKGLTPLFLSVPESKTSYALEIRKSGYRTLRKTWVPTGDMQQKVTWNLRVTTSPRKGFITISSTPPAIIYINGITTEKKQLQRYPLAPGKYQISFVTKDGEVWDADIQVTSGKETTLHSQYRKK